MSMPAFNPFLHRVNKNPSSQIHTVYTDNSPVRVDELICDLGPYAACVDHCAHTTGKAGNYGYLFCVFCGKRGCNINLYIRKEIKTYMNICTSYPEVLLSCLPHLLCDQAPCWWKEVFKLLNPWINCIWKLCNGNIITKVSSRLFQDYTKELIIFAVVKLMQKHECVCNTSNRDSIWD